jgi:hypothetical protein
VKADADSSEAQVSQSGAAAQRVRNRLFGLAADLTATAAWGAIDT